MATSTPSVLIVGVGIAGLAAARSLLAQGSDSSVSVCLVEAEELVCTQASARNAAIFRPLETDPLLVEACARTAEILEDLQEDATGPLLRRRGFLMLDRTPEALEIMASHCERVGFETRFIAPKQLPDVAHLPLRHQGPALFAPGGGELAPHEIAQALVRRVRRRGGVIELGKRATELLIESGRCNGVRLDDGSERRADVTVLAAGASCGRLALQAGLPLPLVPLRRHLAVVAPHFVVPQEAPAIWALEPEVYFRPEPGGLLISPCDETPHIGATIQADLDTLGRLPERLEPLLPELADAEVRRIWACVRTKAVDGRPIIGPCHRTPGLAYFAGLGGFGMSCGLGLADELAASLLHDRNHSALAPARLQLPASASGPLRSAASSL